MPLPDGPALAWPPPDAAALALTYRKWAAWYSGSTDKLSDFYGGTATTTDPKAYDLQGRRGMLQRFRERFFWGNRQNITDNSLRRHRLHIPLAGDIATISADLLFGESLKIRIEDDDHGPVLASSTTSGSASLVPAKDPTRDFLEDLLDEGGMLARLLEAAEVGAGYGGVFLRCGWDKAVSDTVIISSITPDYSVPEWRSGYLTAITFWKELARDGGTVWRHLERHEPGLIWHGLYQGDDEHLGSRVPLTDRPETATFAQLVGPNGSTTTGSKRLAVEYFPNMLPNRDDPGSPIGRSDYAAPIDGIMDSLDEAWTSWMRDIRIGKGRIMIPEAYLSNQGRGAGAVWDPEQEVYQAVDALPGSEGMALSVVQFGIRVKEHADTCQALITTALRSAGYSAQTFGEDGTVAATATEVVARERRSYTTRARKIMYWRPGLTRFLATCLDIAIAQFSPDGVHAAMPTVQWPDMVANDPESNARAVQMLYAAEAASLYTRIKMVNPDWEDAQIREEVNRIREDQAMGIPDVLAGVTAGTPVAGGGSGAAGAGGGVGNTPPPASKPATATAATPPAPKPAGAPGAAPKKTVAR